MLLHLLLALTAPATDWGGLQAAAESYAICTHTAAGPYVRSSRNVESIVKLAMQHCTREAQRMRVETRKAYEPIGLSQAELNQAAEEQFAKQMDLMRAKLGEAIRKYRR
jgi:hypothetical protein